MDTIVLNDGIDSDDSDLLSEVECNYGSNIK